MCGYVDTVLTAREAEIIRLRLRTGRRAPPGHSGRPPSSAASAAPMSPRIEKKALAKLRAVLEA
jgi:hypothetical protein